MKLRLSHNADRQLEDIWFYTLSEWGEQQADDYVGLLEHGFKQLLDNPLLGKARSDIKADLRVLPVRKHLIFYRANGEFIDIFAILHGRADIDSRLESL